MKNQSDVPRSAARALESSRQLGDGKRRSASPDQRPQVEVVLVDAGPDRAHAVVVAGRTPRGDAPAELPQFLEYGARLG